MKNSTIYKNPEEWKVLDFTNIGIKAYEDRLINIHQENHFFAIGDALFYNLSNSKFEKALAENSVFSEVCGLVSNITSIHEFEIITFGEIETNRYAFDIGTILYLSDVQPGKLVSIHPAEIVKEIAVQTENGILINIKRALKTTATSDSNIYEPYTQAELDEIILNIW